MDYTDILVGVISTTGVLGAAVLPGYISNRRKTQAVSEKTDSLSAKIGEPNGHGSIVNMIADLLHISNTSINRISELERADDEKRRMLKDLSSEICEIKTMLKQLLDESHEDA